MLQKPSQKSKARDHAKYPASRLEMWKKGKLDKLYDKGTEIQKRMLKTKQHAAESNRKAFCRLMFEGKVRQATKFIETGDTIKGVHSITPEVKHALAEKHPKAEECSPDAMLTITKPVPNAVIFEQISPELVQKCSKLLTGSGGPTLADADLWKYFLCSRAYGKQTYHLAEAVSSLAKILCSEKIHPDSLQEFMSCRLIPLDKGADKHGNIGIRPIGIGEALRRIIGKSVMTILKSDIQKAGGCLQTCTGIRSGIEASIHATNTAWNLQSTECLLQVDADNAFNRLNRKVALHNIQEICPPLATFLFNHYQCAAPLYVKDNTQQEMFLSEEGCTQGDPSAMAFYAGGAKPLVDDLANSVNKEDCKQAWYADDSSATGKLKEVKTWWLKLNEAGPKYGYFPKASKSVLILKNESLLPYAQELFAGCNIQITCLGERHLGAVVGTEAHRDQYVKKKVDKWIKDVSSLAEIAQEEPQAALSAYTKSICHRWVFVQRTIPNIKHLFIPLEECIREVFIPAVVGRNISEEERTLLSLPIRFSELGIANPSLTADREYDASRTVTEDLADLILRQEQDLSLYNPERTAEKVKNLKAAKELYLSERFNTLFEETPDTMLKRCMTLNREKGASSWLTALPLKDRGFCLNKQEFRDAVSLRYGWRIPNTPQFCACGQANSINHALICRKGGYTFMRHNALRDLNAELQTEVCKDVTIEPTLLPTDNKEITGTTANGAAPDISSRGLWSTFQRTFYDVRVLHPNCPSYLQTSVSKLYEDHEKQKMKKYNSRIITVEKGTFTPLVYSTFGGCGPLAKRYHKRLAELISRKRNEEYHHVANHIRMRIRFALLKSVLIALRGERGKRTATAKPVSSTSFNMIPESMDYECF